MIQKINTEGNISLEELNEKVAHGARFISFQYCISWMFAVTQRRFSSAILIENEKQKKYHQRRCNALSLLFGWWGIPWGPIYTFKSLQINHNGGLDVTLDVMKNISDEALLRQEVDILEIHEVFCAPTRWNLKSFKRCLPDAFARNIHVKRVVVALFINTEADEEPFHTIGLVVDGDFDKYVAQARESLSKEFRETTFFEFINLRLEDERAHLLIEQGVCIMNREL